MVLKLVGVGDLQIVVNQYFYFFVKDFHFLWSRFGKKGNKIPIF